MSARSDGCSGQPLGGRFPSCSGFVELPQNELLNSIDTAKILTPDTSSPIATEKISSTKRYQPENSHRVQHACARKGVGGGEFRYTMAYGDFHDEFANPRPCRGYIL